MGTEERVQRIAALGYDYEARDKERLAACNLCGSTRLVEAARGDRYGYPAMLRICAGCGLGFISPRMTAAEYSDFYHHVYRPLVSAYHGRLIDATTVQDEQRGYAAELAAFLRHSLPRAPATLIDVGGSTGVVAGVLAEAFGSRATVLDPAPDELLVAREAGMETVADFAEDYDPEGRTWDLVLLCQTIDHLLDVSATLAAIRRMLASEGHAFVDVLDLAFAMRRGAVEGAVKIDHPFYLTRDTALGFFAAAGIEVAAERLSDDGHWGFLLRAGEPTELDRDALRRHADGLLERIWALRGERR
jgi:2-polyprenyl-3-methyl-5-hydroxy-6-metoxy-1,4-benzoquinol methylase